MEKEAIHKYILIGCFLALIFLSYKIIKPYFSALAGSAVLAYIFHPIYNKFLQITKREKLSSFLTCLLIIILIIIPLIIISNILIQESVTIYKSDFINKLEEFTSKYTSEDFPYSGIISQAIFKSLDYIRTSATQFFINLPSGILSFIISIYTLYFLLIKGDHLVKDIVQIIPIKDRAKLLKNIGKTTFAIIYGFFAVAAFEVILSTLGFGLVGLSSPALWGIIIGFLALVPFLGPAVVWLPLALVEFLGDAPKRAIGIVIVGIIISIFDTFVRPKIIGDESQMSPVIVLIGILGGVTVFGFIGLLLGPLVLSTSLEVIKSYHTYTHKETK